MTNRQKDNLKDIKLNKLKEKDLKDIKERNEVKKACKKKISDKDKEVLKEGLDYQNKLNIKNEKTKLEKKIKRGLIKQLKDKGYTEKENPYIFDKLEDYTIFFKIKNALVKDLEHRGLIIEWSNSETSKGEKLNESLAMLLKVDAQMLKILNFLDLKPTNKNLKEDDDNALL